MSLFAAMGDENSVWAQGSSLFNISSPLNDLLETDNFTLEQVMQEDELIQELKTRNIRLSEFLSQEDIAMKLIEYVVRKPEEGSDDLRKLKYPYMACEIICCDVARITETIASGKEGKIVETLFEFLDQPGDLDPRLAGYFEKIVSLLMVRKPQEMTTLMNTHSERLLKGFLSHAQSFSITELFKRLLQPFSNEYTDDMMDFPGMQMGFPPSNAWYGGMPDEDEASVGTPTSSTQKALLWQSDTTVVDLLLDNLKPVDKDGKTIDSDVHKHSADVLVDIIHCSSRAQQTDPTSPSSPSAPASVALLEYMDTKAVAERIADLAIPPPDATFVASSMTSALSVLSALLARHSNARYVTVDELPASVASAVARIPQLCATLRAEDHDAGTIRNQRFQEVPRLGLRRLKLVGLVVLLMHTKLQKVDAALLQENAIDICLDLFFKFESVNMLHADVESMVIGILESGSPELLDGLIKKSQLLKRILEAHEQNAEATKQPRGFSLGFVGHLHRICNMIISLTEDARGDNGEERQSLNDLTHADSVIEMLEEDKTLWQRWEELSKAELIPLYERERMPIGGSPMPQSANDMYAMGGTFSENQRALNEKFAEMLGSPEFDPRDDTFDNEFDSKGPADTPMLPELHDSSSDSDEEDDRPQGDTFNPDSFSSSGKTGTEEPGSWASFESGASWANFEKAANAFSFPLDGPDFEPPDSPPAMMEFFPDSESPKGERPSNEESPNDLLSELTTDEPASPVPPPAPLVE